MNEHPRPRGHDLTEWMVAFGVVVVAITLAAFGVWVFRAPTRPTTSLTSLVLSDRATLGLVRMLVVVTALYGLASIAVSIMRGRWLRSISASGVELDASRYSDKAVAKLEDELRKTLEELDETRFLLRRLRDG